MSNKTNRRKKKNNKYKPTVHNYKTNGPIRSGKKTKKSKSQNSNKKSMIKKIVIIAVLVLFLLILIASGVFVGVFFSDKFALTKEDLLIGASNTIIYDSEGNVIAELSGKENRQIISIDDMSEYLPNAFVAIEDERFYQHKGVDVKRSLAATFTYVTHSGSSNFGGSTITQQLVKNITNEKDSSGSAGMQRKIREMSRAYQIEKMIDKKNILELYLNLIPLASSGGDICGVETASRFYFNKSASELSIEECAFLAGVTHSPTQYNPYKENPNTDKINNRTKVVLGKMKELGYISDEQYNEAIGKVDEGLKFNKGELPTSTVKDFYVSAVVDEVIKDLVEQKGMSEEYARNRVFNGGLKIYTSQIASIQKNITDEFKDEKYLKKATLVEGAHLQGAMVVIDHKTGKVVGCIGGLGSDVDAVGINRINSKRQPGSSIKPIGVYGPAIEKGIINAATIYDNTYPTTFGTTYKPRNASNQKAGLCTIRDAIEVSSNIVACKVLSELTPDAAIDFMRDLGITSLVKASESTNGHNDSSLPTALGAVSYGISPLQMAGAYATIANDGVYIEPSFYTKVEDPSGNILIESKQETRRVFSEENAFIMKSLLKQPVEGSQGTAKICKMSNIDVGAKTGTTQDVVDLWLCGITPYYTGATYVGFDKPETINTSGGSPATIIWANVMKNIHSGLEGKRFEKTANVVSATVCRTSGKCATGSCSSTYTEYFVEGNVPGKCEGHNAFEICSETKKLATEYCPHKETTYGLAKPEKEVNPTWKTDGGGKYTVITEKCDVHTKDTADKDKENGTSVTIETPKKEDTDIKVQNVIGLSEAEARKKLSPLTVNKKETKTSDSSKVGKVISQSILPDKYASKNASITIEVGIAEPKKTEQPTTPTTPTEPTTPDKPAN